MVTVMVGYVGEVYYTFSDSFSSFYEEVKYCGKSIELHIFWVDSIHKTGHGRKKWLFGLLGLLQGYAVW